MGLYDDLQKDIKAALEGDLNDAYKDFTVTIIGSPIYDKATGEVTSTDTTEPFSGVVVKNNIGSVLDNSEEMSTFDVLVLDSDKPFEFEVDHKIHYFEDGNDYRIVGFVIDPIKASWVLKCIIWN